MTTVVIAAHNEAAVIGRCLDRLLADARPGELEVIVSANGCTDATAEIARTRAGVTVVESPVAGKCGALNRAEAVAHSYPRVYLDADILVPTDTVRALVDALDRDPARLVATPSRVLDVAGRPLAVRAYYAVQSRLPVFEEGLFGRGLIAVSRCGRERFTEFPEILADDLFLDSLFSRAERVRLQGVATTVVQTPFTTAALLHRLVRVRRGNRALRSDAPAAGPAVVRSTDSTSWLRDVVLRRPWLAPAAVLYVALTALAELASRRPSTGSDDWGHDETSRLAVKGAPRP